MQKLFILKKNMGRYYYQAIVLRYYANMAGVGHALKCNNKGPGNHPI